MLTFAPEALQYAHEKGSVLHLEYLIVNNCCIPFQEAPTVRFGKPHDPKRYGSVHIEGVTVYIPSDLPDVPLTIKLSKIAGFRRLTVDGWRHA